MYDHWSYALHVQYVEKRISWQDVGKSWGECDTTINDRDPADTGLLVRADFKIAVEAVKWTTEEKAKGLSFYTNEHT